jgi:hypothetical protein
MTRRNCLGLAAIAAWAVLVGAPALADQIDLSNRGDAEVVAAVTLVDKLAAMCVQAGGMDAPTRAALASWNAANNVDLVRGEMRRLANAPDTRRAMQGVDAQADTLLADKRAQSCQGLRSERGARESVAPNIRAIANQIEGFAFDTRAGIGMGGMVSLVIYPVVLFKDGRVLTDVEGLGFAGGIDAHRRSNPGDWSQWRRAGGRVQTMEDGAWANLPFTAVYQRVPAGFALDGRYQRTGGVGNIAMGGADAVTTWETYDFFPGGRVIKGGGAGAQATGGDFTTVSRSVSPDRRGRYAIDGLTLVLTYDDGSTESAIFVTDPQDPKVVWLNGRDFRRVRPR